ncbi:hypothetical protein F66182_800 [Fusarium sp. NRRL 66182]|nr:hypothetical protein F66182_800 [Fusarium sp. NRRL 66182]
MQSRLKLHAPETRDRATRGKARGHDRDYPQVDLDAVFAHTLGLQDGQEVTVVLHLEPSVVDTVNVEPLTPEDWDMVELHANFLEFNLVRQVRALPNPQHTGSPGGVHPITVHLSPTTTVNLKVISLDPFPDSTFGKLSPNAEVIIAPKTRQKSSSSRSRTGSSVKTSSSARGREPDRVKMFFRGADRSCCGDWFEDNQQDADEGLKVWVDRDVRLSDAMKGITWVSVSILHQPSFQAKVNPQNGRETTDNGNTVWVAPKVIARLEAWHDAPDSKLAALSSSLCTALVSEGMIGVPVKIEAAPEERILTRTSPTLYPTSQRVYVYPFSDTSGETSAALKLGAGAKKERQDAAQFITDFYKQPGVYKGLLDGPLTDGCILGPLSSTSKAPGWLGGILRFDEALTVPAKPVCNWFLSPGQSLVIEVKTPIPSPLSNTSESSAYSPMTDTAPALAGVDNILAKVKSHVLHESSVLLIGGSGSGKSSAAMLMWHQLRSEHFFHCTYISCQKMSANEERIVTVKDTLEKSFLQAALSARLGGHAIVILDDLDKLCPVETELEVGGDNARAKQMSEMIATVIKKYCSLGSKIVVLATAQAKESLHNVIVGNHVFRETLPLDVANKACRRKILEMIIQQGTAPKGANTETEYMSSRPETADETRPKHDSTSWMDVFDSTGAAPMSAPHPPCKFEVDVDFADLTNLTESYLPRDLMLFVERAKYIALSRSISDDVEDDNKTTVPLRREHFDEALKGFTPISLRNMSLATSTTTFSSIGGMAETRRVLLETIEYPTRYAPIFAQCPLRLRSGLLLYGYPGCGKTLLASAVAGECGLNFISVKGPEILNKYIGASEKSIRDLFERASASRPCVLFFDEFDSIAPKRGSDSTGVTDRVVNQLLTQMDGVEGLSGVYVLAATSRPDLIDPALLRPGRLDKSLICDLPHLEDRIDILKCLIRKLELEDDLEVELDDRLRDIAARTQDYSGADLQALISNAQLEAIHEYLEEHEASTNPTTKTNGKAQGTEVSRRTSILQFQFGEADDLTDSVRSNLRPNSLAEYEAIMSRLRSSKKSARQARRGLPVEDRQKSKDKVQIRPEVRLGWRHLQTSLNVSRASIKTDEKQRLSLVYDEFVNGRAAELRNGQGGTAVGSRGTLM